MNDDRWGHLRTQCEALEPGSVLLTPVSDRRFDVRRTDADLIVVSFADSGEERPLWREQFSVLVDQLETDRIDLDALQPGVEPYAVILSLADEFAVRADALVYEPDSDVDADEGEDNPFVVPASEARTQVERIHDDALLLAALVERLDLVDEADLSRLDTDVLTDCYVLSSDVQRGADRLRKAAREPILERLGPDQTLHGRYGTVRRTTRTRRRPKDDETVFAALDDHGVPREWVTGVDPSKLDVVVEATDLEETDVFDVEETVYAQKTGIDEDEKYSRLQGIADRIESLEGPEGEALRDELETIENRLEDALSAD
ncbi:hypothetical protein [Natrarchaeobaculum aegyptiacum]|uniref:DUF2800 domain-containing protein n=1 Tax=Natrarchaeobaculum aegyptiacum TaxID=745377 RepID=A0A2Z2HVR5_9EURY|nr:hypothetical protein [Natrarchaeobaculum aegyptiacum]ARS91311.1 hypothetical protein B1756_17345 [Natrarchaeobaculum aegyptiacum]